MKKVLNFCKRAIKAYIRMSAQNCYFRMTGDCSVYCDPTTGRAYISRNGIIK